MKVGSTHVQGRVQIRSDDVRDRGVGPTQRDRDVAERSLEDVSGRHLRPLHGDAPAVRAADLGGRLIQRDHDPEDERDHDGDGLERKVTQEGAAQIDPSPR